MPADMTLIERKRNTVAARIARRCSPESIQEAREDLNWAVGEKSIRALIARTPPLTAEQRKKLAALLVSGMATPTR